MALAAVVESSRRNNQSLIPSSLYSSSSSSYLNPILNSRAAAASNPSGMIPNKKSFTFFMAAPTEPSRKIEMYSPAFYVACTARGILSCGLTHMTVTPLYLIKCNMQVVLELQDEAKLSTSDDPPVVFGCLDGEFIQKSELHLGNLVRFDIGDEELSFLDGKLQKADLHYLGMVNRARAFADSYSKWGGAKNRKSYTQEELDEVRIEVAHYIETFL